MISISSLMTAAAAAPAAGGPSPWIGILPWVLIFVIFYFLMIRPQQKRVKEHQKTVAGIQKGDEIITAGGIRARVTKVIDEREAEVEIAQGVKVRIVKATISQVLTAPTKPAND